MAKTRAIRIKGKFPNLRNVPTDVLRQAMPQIVRRVTEQAKTEAPKKRGAGAPKSLVRRISGKVVREGERGIVASKAPHSHLIEYGVKPHSLAPGSGKKRLSKKNPHKVMYIPGTGYRRAPIMGPAHFPFHAGHSANPFMERAVPNSQGDVNRILQAEGDRAFEEAVQNAVEDWSDALDKVIA